MRTLNKLLSGLETKYKINSILAPIMMIGEVLMEVLIPTIMARIIDVGIANRDIISRPFLQKIYKIRIMSV